MDQGHKNQARILNFNQSKNWCYDAATRVSKPLSVRGAVENLRY